MTNKIIDSKRAKIRSKVVECRGCGNPIKGEYVKSKWTNSCEVWTECLCDDCYSKILNVCATCNSYEKCIGLWFKPNVIKSCEVVCCG